MCIFFILKLIDYDNVLITLLLSLISYNHGFNLETRIPLIKLGNNGSYFGYAVAAHQIRNESTGSIVEGLLLVGAPLDKNLQPGVERSGALWKCPLTNKLDDCSQVVTDGRRDPDRQSYNDIRISEVDTEQLLPPGKDEVKKGQWLGVTVKSQGPAGKVMVCAHRYIVTESYWGRGLCYILKQDLSFEKAWEPCKGKSVIRNNLDYGFCLSGTSGMIFDDDNVIIGSPGPLNMRGAIFVFSISDNFLDRDKTIYQGNGTDLYDSEYIDNVTKSEEKIKKDSYLGMSVTAGYFIGNNITVYVAGAPRSKETGEVILFVKQMNYNRNTYDNYLKIYQIISGEQIASNFGYEVATADLNGDNYPDLIVTAPFYFDFKAEIGGMVYVYMTDPITHLNNTVPVKLPGKPESRFGFAVTSLGDLNKDGCDDIAIGAPYEKNGVVYIYLGSRDGLITKASQIIEAKTISTNLPISTFGYSLSGGIDLDNNGYPDLVIGAYEKDMVMLLRARPIIGLKTSVKPEHNLTNIDSNARNCLINNTNYISCFSFETCCTIDQIVRKYSTPNLLIRFQLEAETFNNNRKSSRIWFDDFRSKNHIITKVLNITNSNLKYCQNHTAYLKENTQDIQSPIQIRMSYKLINKEPEPLSGNELLSLDDFPILDQPEADKVFEATFLKDCGNNDICESNLLIQAAFQLERLGMTEKNHYQLVLGENQKLLLNISVNNVGESAYEAQLFVRFPKRINFGRLLDLPPEKKQYICNAQDTLLTCKLGNPLKQNEVVFLQLEFDLETLDETDSLLEFVIFANTTSIDEENDIHNLRIKVVDKIALSINGYSVPGEIPNLVNLNLKDESVVKFKDEIGNKIAHHYIVFNNGSWNIKNLEVEIEWPYQLLNDGSQRKWLLYLDEVPIVDGDNGLCDISEKHINPLHLVDRKPDEISTNYSSSNFELSYQQSIKPEKSEWNEKMASSNALYNRLKRSTNIIVPETYNTNGKSTKIVKMNCLLGTAKCIKFKCNIESIDSRQFTTIIIKSRLWDASLIENYFKVDLIKIGSRAKMYIPESNIRLPNIYSNEFQIESTARIVLPGQQPAVPVPFYILIGAIAIGLLLFILLTLLLWKLGFFKRHRPTDPTLSGNLEKHRIDEYHDY